MIEGILSDGFQILPFSRVMSPRAVLRMVVVVGDECREELGRAVNGANHVQALNASWSLTLALDDQTVEHGSRPSKSPHTKDTSTEEL